MKQIQIGTFRRKVGVLAAEYQHLADEDEAVGLLLLAQNRHRHAAYLFIQAMEKVVCACILQLRNDQEMRERLKHHRLDDIVETLIGCLESHEFPLDLRDALKKQLDGLVIRGLKFGELHNNLRYPRFQGRQGRFEVLELGLTDADSLLSRLEALKKFAKEIAKLSGKRRHR